MTDIVAFLTARLDEDEITAKLATAGPWSYNPSKQWQAPGDNQLQGQECVTYGTPPAANSPAAFGPPLPSGGCVATTGPADDLQSMIDAAHIARHNPVIALREVVAKRRLLVQAARLRSRGGIVRSQLLEGFANGIERNLAAPYADHPDYDPAWRVE